MARWHQPTWSRRLASAPACAWFFPTFPKGWPCRNGPWMRRNPSRCRGVIPTSQLGSLRGLLEILGLGDGFTLTLASDLAEIARVTERLARFGREHRLADRPVQHMTLALDELITNVVEHGAAGNVM